MALLAATDKLLQKISGSAIEWKLALSPKSISATLQSSAFFSCALRQRAAMNHSVMNPLEKRLKYKFRNPLLLAESMTHPSLGHETQRHHFDNKRLEFLGDAVLQLIFTEWLFDHFKTFSEGQLTKMRSRLVSRDGLTLHALRLELGQHLMMGRGEEANGGRERSSALADAYEALIGAIYLDSDYVTARRIVLSEAREDLENLDVDPPGANPKGRLQEILQAISPVSPKYMILNAIGPEHQKHFTARVVWNKTDLGQGNGNSKKEAETAAALDALRQKVWEISEDEQPADNSGVSADNLQ